MKYFTLVLILILTISLHGVDLKRTQRRKLRTCSYENHINGCSIPGDLPFFYKELFTPACNEHDVCYFCGEKYGMSRKKCDSVFLAEMKSICSTLRRKRWFTKTSNCVSVADIYHFSVYWFGGDYFEKISPAWCEDTCVKQYLTKNFNLSA